MLKFGGRKSLKQCSRYIRVGKYLSTSLPTLISWQQCLENFDAKGSWAHQGKQGPEPRSGINVQYGSKGEFGRANTTCLCCLLITRRRKLENKVGGLIWKKSANSKDNLCPFQFLTQIVFTFN